MTEIRPSTSTGPIPKGTSSPDLCDEPSTKSPTDQGAANLSPPFTGNGWVIIDKPVEMTSTQVVTKVRRLSGVKKVGHGGTLDPLASGLLPVALGEATKTTSYVMEGRKVYLFEVRWGISRTTDDREGEITEENSQRPSKAEIEAILPRFTGSIQQIPPQFSAIKVKGQRAYDLSRKGQTVELKPRAVEIFDLRLLDFVDRDHARFEAVCGKGTYIRSLARDLGQALGTCAHISSLRRLAVGPFTEKNAISLEKFESLAHSAQLHKAVLSVETALDDIPAVALTQSEAQRLKNGQPVSMIAKSNAKRLEGITSGEKVRAMMNGKLVAISLFEAGEIKPLRVLHLV